MESKELPQDVTDIISQFSKPTFVHFREYNEALRLFDLTLDYKEKLKEKIGDPLVLEQLKICIDARVDYKKKDNVYFLDKTQINQEILDKSKWWDCVSLEKLAALLDETQYRMRGFAEWYFQEDIDDAWRNSDDDNSVKREEDLERQEEWLYGLDNDNESVESYSD